MSALTPYDLGTRAEPKLWVTSTQGLGASNSPDDWGRVDLNNDSDETVAVIYMERNDDGTYVLVVEAWDDIIIDRRDA